MMKADKANILTYYLLHNQTARKVILTGSFCYFEKTKYNPKAWGLSASGEMKRFLHDVDSEKKGCYNVNE